MFITSALGTTLPNGYTELEYLESTGTQYIDTGISYQSTDTFKLDFMVTDLSSSKHVVSNNRVDQTDAFFQVAQTSTLLLADINNDGSGIGRVSTDQITSLNNRIKVYIPDGQTVYMNDTLIGTAPNPLNTNSNTLRLFGSYISAESNIRIYSLKIGNKAYLIPAKRDSDGVLGMYDMVSGTFYTNAGSGTFTAGHRLPSGYTELEYINESGENKYIDTGYFPNASRTRIVTKVDFLGEHLDQKLCNAGEWLKDLYQIQRLNDYDSDGRRNNNKIRIYYYTRGSSSDYNTNTSFLEQDNPVYIDFNKNVLNINGNTVHSFTNKNTTTSTTLRIFYQDAVGNNNMNLYYFRIYDNDTLVRDFIPAKRNSDNEVGLYDLVNDVFYTNSGTGTFTAGPEILPTPSIITINWGGVELDSDDPSRTCVYGETFVVPSVEPTPPNGYKFIGWTPL